MNGHILIVDGDAHNRLLMDVGLRGAGLSVYCAASQAEALRLAEHAEVDLIVGEVDLPDAEPFALAEIGERTQALLECPVVFITRRDSVEDKIAGLERGAEDYLTKPIYLREFVARIAAILKKQEVTRLTPGGLRQHYAGRISPDLVLDIVRSMLSGNQTGRLEMVRLGRPGRITFAKGKLVNAEVGRVSGVEAASRLLVWEQGEFEVFFDEFIDTDLIGNRTEIVVDVALNRRRQWERLTTAKPAFAAVPLADLLSLQDLAPPHPEGLDGLLELFDFDTLAAGELPQVAALSLPWTALSDWIVERLKMDGRGNRVPRPENDASDQVKLDDLAPPDTILGDDEQPDFGLAAEALPTSVVGDAHADAALPEAEYEAESEAESDDAPLPEAELISDLDDDVLPVAEFIDELDGEPLPEATPKAASPALPGLERVEREPEPQDDDD